MKKKKEKVAPARARYELNHPTVSFRINPELDARLRAVKKTGVKSNTELMEIAVGMREVKVANENEVRAQGYKEGFRAVYERAKIKYLVTYPCQGCRKLVEVDTPLEKEAIKKFMSEAGWGHGECINREE